VVSGRRAARARHGAAQRIVVAAPAAVLLLVVAALVAARTSSREHGTALAAAVAAAPEPQATTPAATSSADPLATPAPVRSVVALGDSVPAGTGCDCTPYVDVLAANLGQVQGTTVTPSNDAVSGETSEGLLAALAQPDVRTDIRNADLVVVQIGANDFDASAVTDASCSSAACYVNDLASLRTTLDRILDTVRGLAGDGAEIVLTGYWNVFLDGAAGQTQGQGYVENSDALTRATNAAIEAVARDHQATYVDIYTPFKGDGSKDDTALLAADGDHPSARGHQVIASAITRAVTSS
jgi:lysophospholipase L1-like esterase